MGTSPEGREADRSSRPRTHPGRTAPEQTHPSVIEQAHDIRGALHLETVADPAGATRMRREFTRWLRIDVADPQSQDIVLAVYEALANAAEHAYTDRSDGSDTMWLTAHRGPNEVRIAVADTGQWRPHTGAGAPFRGRGLALMRALMTHVHLRSDTRGTLVQLRTTV